MICRFGFGLLLVAGLLASTRAQEVRSRYVEEYPTASSKKGLQVEWVEDALTLGVKHAALNLNLCQLVRPTVSDPADPSWQHDGKTYRFSARYLESMDRKIKALSDRHVLVSVILLTYLSGKPDIDRVMIHPRCAPDAPNRLGAFNTATEEGRQWLAATLEFLSERWSKPSQEHGRVVNWIVGNEVNSHWWWSNMGRVSMQDFAADYAQAVRIVHRAVRSQSSWGRVFVSLEHHWNIRFPAGDDLQAFPARPFLLHFAELVRRDGDFDWHVAFHPYPENLFEPRFWLNQSATDTADTKRITFKNLPVLLDFLQSAELQYQSTTRRVILSEQGFHTPDGPDGERIQAAAYCYAYKIVERLDGIDAFILHRHIDHAAEGGLHLGLRSNQPQPDEPRPKKLIYACFAAADTAGWESAFAFALPILGVKRWDELPGLRD